MKIHLIIILTLLLTSCLKNAKGTENQKTEGYSKTVIIDQSLSNGTIKDSVLIENKVMHAFSQTDNKDEFYICIKGKSFTEGNFVFTIKNFEGVEIYRIEFPSIQLINPGLLKGIGAPIKDQEDFIKKRILEFFKEEAFLKPAISKDEIFDENYSEKNIWEEIKNDRNIIGFHYLIGEEDGRSIAFSMKKKKVIMYFNCC